MLGFDLTNRLIGSGLSNRLSSLVCTKIVYCNSRDNFEGRVSDCSATRFPFTSNAGCHPRLTGDLIEVGLFFAVDVFYNHSNYGGMQFNTNIPKCKVNLVGHTLTLVLKTNLFNGEALGLLSVVLAVSLRTSIFEFVSFNVLSCSGRITS